MTDHCFISYSTADALDFAAKLADELEGGYPYINAWFDKRDLRSEVEWDKQLSEAIKTCKCMLFVMTQDSTAEGSVTAEEWDWALRYKKPVVPLRLHRDVEVPFRLGRRQWIDFSSNFVAGMAKLRMYIAWLDSPEGKLQALQDRLADANRDLHRARSEDAARIQADIDDLKDQIKRQEEIARNPKAAEEQTEKNIQAGLDRERKPEKPIAAIATTKFINPPPGIAPIYFQDRYFETTEIVKFLKDDSQRLMIIVGRGGVGKTAMVCRLLKALESGQLPENQGEMKIDGIVYLSERGNHNVSFPHIFADLSRLLPSEISDELVVLYKDPKATTENKMNALLEHFQGDRVILLLDNFEPIVDPELQAIIDSDLYDALCTLISGPHHMVDVIITTRIAPRDLNVCEPGRQRFLVLDEGLRAPYAENILREMDEDGKLGLKIKEVNDPLLQRAREMTRGYPRALEALFNILSSDRYTTLEELVDMPLPENVVEALVGEAFSRLDASAQKVMQALSIYDRPVIPAAVDYLLQPFLTEIDSAPVLKRLSNMHFVRYEAGRYYLHPIDREYAFSTFPMGEKIAEEEEYEYDFDETDFDETDFDKEFDDMDEFFEDSDDDENLDLNLDEIEPENFPIALSDSYTEFTYYDLVDRAADYFFLARKPRAEWKTLDDMVAQIAEFDLRCAAEDYDTAMDILAEIDFDYLLLWGHFRLMIDLHMRLKDKLTDKALRIGNLNGLGLAFDSIGKYKESILFYQQGLAIAQEEKDRESEGAFLGNLGNVYANLGDVRKAIEFYEQALAIAREISDRQGEGSWLGNLGIAYSDLGDMRKAIEFHEQALAIAREISDRQGEGSRLGNLGIVYSDLGDMRKAIEFYEQALAIAREIGDRQGEGSRLGNLGIVYSDLGDVRKAIEFYEQALVIAREIGDRKGEGSNLGNIGSAYSDLGDMRKAIEFYEQALAIAREISDRKNEGIWLGNLGGAYSDTGDTHKAIEFYEQALAIARETDDRSHESENIGSIGHALLSLEDFQIAEEKFEQSIQIADEISLFAGQRSGRYGLAQAYLNQNDLENVFSRIEEALQYDIPRNNHNIVVLHGIINLRKNDGSEAESAFTHAISLADEILAKTPEYYEALDAKGLSLCGLALTKNLIGFTGSLSDGKAVGENTSTSSAHRLSGLIAQASETFRAARKIAPHAGIVKATLRLFDELVKCDPEGLLEGVRAAVEGKGYEMPF